MKKTSKIILTISIIIILALGAFTYYNFFYKKPGKTITLPNPIVNLTDEEAIGLFDESFVRYLLYSIGANELHAPLFSSNTPKIELRIDEDSYNAEIKDGNVRVEKGQAESKDIILTTTKTEAIRMLRNKNYITQSFQEGKSSIELIESKTKLFTKGYLNIYERLTGETVNS